MQILVANCFVNFGMHQPHQNHFVHYQFLIYWNREKKKRNKTLCANSLFTDSEGVTSTTFSSQQVQGYDMHYQSSVLESIDELLITNAGHTKGYAFYFQKRATLQRLQNGWFNVQRQHTRNRADREVNGINTMSENIHKHNPTLC